MPDVLKELQEIQESVELATRQRARAESDIEVGKVRLRESLATLKKEFGVTTIDEARKLLAEREEELRQTVREIAEQL